MLTKKSKSFKQLFSLFILLKNNGIVAALSYFLTITLANHLGPDLFGTYSHALIVASIVSIFINFGTDQTAAILRSYYSNVGDVFNNIYFMRLVIALPVLVILLFMYFDNLKLLMYVFCLMVANYNLAFMYEIKNRNEKYSYIYLIERMTYVGAAFLLIYFDLLELSYLFTLLFLVSIFSISYQMFENAHVLHSYSKLRPRLLRQAVKESAPLVVVALSTFAYGGFSRLVLEGQLGQEQLGIYSAGWQLITVGTIFQAQVIRLWRVPISDAVHALDVKGLFRTINSYLLLSTLPMIFMCCVFVFFSELIAAILFTNSYAEVANILPVFGVYLVIINIAGLVDMLWVALRRGAIYMMVNLIFGAVLIEFLWECSSSMGMVEFASATVVFHSLTILTLVMIWIRIFRFRLCGT